MKEVHDKILMNSHWLSRRFKGKEHTQKMLNIMTLKPLMHSGGKKISKAFYFFKVLLNSSIFPEKNLEICHSRYRLLSQKFIQEAL